MRVTQNMMMSKFKTNLSSNLERMDRYQMQIATNKRITRLSDDPIGVIGSMTARVRLYRIEQYSKNVETAQGWLEQAETSIKEMNGILQDAYELAVNSAGTDKTEEDKQKNAEVIKQLRDHVVQIGNTMYGDKYIFGGYNTNRPPFELRADELYYNDQLLSDDTNPDLLAEDAESLQFEIGTGMYTDVSFPGTKILGTGEDHIYAVMDELYGLLMNNGSAEDIGKSITKLQDSQAKLLAKQAEVGGRTTRLEMVSSRYEDDFLSYTDRKSNVEDADQAEVIMQMKMAEAVYLSALNVGAKIIQPTLADFLR
ncbi:flagellar hook-associated protein FlgL [Eubacteriales bacterium OttesenSCG-928-N14]|nr:flagellar hook-associated protein FlgL [Eubacteriales bacterium OttesenSCG-928-N14]